MPIIAPSLESVFELAQEASASVNSFDDVPDVSLALIKYARANALYLIELQKHSADELPLPGVARAAGGVADYAGRIAQLWSGNIAGIPNKPGPLSSMLVMAPLGALLGYGVGKGVHKLTDGHIGSSDTTNALLGAALGMAPGAGYMAANYAAEKPILTGTVLDVPLAKNSSAIPIDKFKEMVYHDPYVASRLPKSIQAAAVGLVEGANNLPGSPSALPIVTPSDIARMAVGLGSGYASGLLVGKALGALFGVSNSAQQVLRRSGAAAGLIQSVIPMAYGFSNGVQ